MSRALSLALGVVVFHRLLAGSEVDFGTLALPGAAALLLVAAGAGLVWRGVASRALYGVALAVLVPLRGPLADLSHVLPASLTADVLGLLLSLVPAGFVLGRLLRRCRQAGPATLLVGATLGELGVALGAAGWLPAWLAGAVCAVLLAALAELARPREQPDDAPAPEDHPAAAVLVGAAAGLLVWCLQRVVVGYATPSPHLASDATLVLLLPAVLVALPASVLAGGGLSRRLLGAAGAALLAVAVIRMAGDVTIHENAMAHVGLSRLLHDRALTLAARLPASWARALHGAGAHLDVWAWLVVFAGQLAAALGLALGAFRGRALGWMLIGWAVAAAAPYALLADPAEAPGFLILLAGGLSAAAVPAMLFGRRGLLALPLGAIVFLDWGGEGLAWRMPPSVGSGRRVGEYTVDAFTRALPADVALFLAPGRDAANLEGQLTYQASFTGVKPAFRFGADGAPEATFTLAGEHAFGAHEESEPVPAAPPQHSRGVRVAGVPLHAGHPPIGPEGSVSRLTRLLARPGAAFVTGLGAELLAADLHDASLASTITVSSAVPLGRSLLNVLLDDCGSAGWQAGEVLEPAAAARAATRGSFASVVVAPGPADAPGVSALLSEEHVQRLAALLQPDGRCLAWVDTQALTPAALAARLAVFGAVFGERSAAFVEPRELDAPFVLLVGWRDAAGAPSAAELRLRLPGEDRTGLRVRLLTPEDLGALLVRDGAGLVALADDGPVLSRARPTRGSTYGVGGWAALAPLVDQHAHLSQVVADARDGAGPSPDLLAGLVAHTRYDYRVEGLNNMMLEIKPDVDWSAWDAEAGAYERAARQQPASPLLHHALAALLEPLAVVGDYGRFADIFTRCDGPRLPSWRLALQEWWVQKGSLEEAAAQAAADRARRLFDTSAPP